MASRKEQKEQARQRRLEQEQAAAAGAQRRRRIQMLVGVVIAAVAVIAVAIAVSSGGGSSGGLAHGKHQRTALTGQVQSLLAGIPQSGETLGNPKARVTIDYYGDLECPVCRAFTLAVDGGGFPQLIKTDVRQGKVKVQYRSFCTATCNNHPQSVFTEQQAAAYAAGKQDLFWDYAELFYRQQGDETSDYVNAKFLNTLADEIPRLNLSKWRTDQKDPAVLEQVQADMSSAQQLKLQGTPTLIAKGPKGEQIVSAATGIPTYSEIEQTIRAVE